MILTIPIFDKLIKYAFFFGIASYSYGISYIYILQNMFITNLILNGFSYIITLFKYKFMALIWDSFLNALLFSHNTSLILFLSTFLFMVYCDYNRFIDNGETLNIPIINGTYIKFQSIGYTFNISTNNKIEELDMMIMDIKKSIINYFVYICNNCNLYISKSICKDENKEK